MFSLLLDTTNPYPMWVQNSFPIIRIVLFCLIVASAIVVIITTLFQNEDSNESNVITGQQESYYSKNKTSTYHNHLFLCGSRLCYSLFRKSVDLQIGFL